MDTFEVLIVDDEVEVTNLMADHFRSTGTIHVHVANSAKRAMEIIRTTFLHVALVDMQLSKNTPDGMGVFNLLRNARPSCKSILLTGFPDRYRTELFVLFNPLFPHISGAIDKGDYGEYATDVVEKLAAAWFSNKKSISGIPEMTQLISLKAPRTDALLTEGEVDFVLSLILGQDPHGQAAPTDPVLGMNSIELRPLDGGRSRSLVYAGRPTDNSGNSGIWCVIKIGPRSDIQQEYHRYSAYVRYSVALNHRVELLGHAFADTIGAICFSFAGRSPESIRSLYQIFRVKESPSRYLTQMFSLETRELYARRGKEVDLARYFDKTYKLEPRKLQWIVQDFLRDVSESLLGGIPSDYQKFINSDRLGRLYNAFNSAIVRRPLKTCVVHGDMNASNVIVAEDGRVIYIDYFHTGCGPRTVDFAALEASLRLATCPDAITDVFFEGSREELVGKTAWERARGSVPLTYWADVSLELTHFARDNFSDLSREEYMITCLLWGARLFRVTQLTNVERLRLLLWMVQCAESVVI